MVLHHIGKLVGGLVFGEEKEEGSSKSLGGTTSSAANPRLLPPPEILQPFGESIWIADGPTVNFVGFPYPTRMVVIRLSCGSAWVWSPIEPSDKLTREVELYVGPVLYIVSPNKIHWLYLKAWQDRFPSAFICASPGLSSRKVVRDVKFHIEQTNDTPAGYADDVSQVIFTTQGIFDEIVYFHKRSRTAIFCDTIQRFPSDFQSGWKGLLMKAWGIVGTHGTAPADLRLVYKLGGHLPAARRALDTVLYEWQPEQLVVAHGQNERENVIQVIANAFRWVPEKPGECVCCCIPYSYKDANSINETSKQD
jgi:hypothetical protein